MPIFCQKWIEVKKISGNLECNYKVAERMNENLQHWKERAIDDLRIITSEEFLDEEGKACHCIYSFTLDSVTFVDDSIVNLLRERGIQELERLPD